MLALLRTISLRQARRHPTRLALMVLSVALGVAAWTTGGTLNRTLDAALRSTSTPLAASADFHVGHGDLGLPRTLADEIKLVPGVKTVRPVLVRRVLLNDLDRQPAVLLGVDLATEAHELSTETLGLKIRDGSPAAFLRAMVLQRNPVLLGSALSAALPQGLNALEILAGGRPRRVTPVGVIEADGPAASLGGHVLVTDLKLAAELIGEPGIVSRFDILLHPDADREAARRALASCLADRGEVLTPEAQDERVRDALEGLRIGFGLCGLGALALALFLTASALGVGAAERRTEVGMLRALGADRGQIARLFLIEALVLGFVGAGIGLPVGWGLAQLTSGPLLRVVSDVFLPLDPRGLETDRLTLVGGLVAGVVTTVLAALVPALRSAWLEPVEALDRGAAERQSRAAHHLFALALGFCLLAVVCFALGDRIGARFRVFGAALLAVVGAVLMIPAVTSFGARLLRPLAERWLGLPGRLAADHLVRTPGRSGMAIASLAGGMALILQTGGVIHGNEEAIRDWVDRCVMGDLFVTSGGPLSSSGRTSPMREEVGARIEEAFPGLRVVPLTFRYLPWHHDHHETRIRLLALDAQRYVRMNGDRQPPLDDLEQYRRLTEPGAMLVSENFAALYGVRVGDRVRLPGAKGEVSLRVAGTVVDFSCNRGTVMVDRTQYAEAFDCGGVDVFAVGLPPGGLATPSEEIRRRIPQTAWGAEQALFVLERPDLRGHILGMVSRIYSVAYVQEIVAAVVAALGVAMALLISVLQRRRELGMLRAVGASPAQAVRMVLVEAVLMAIIGMAFGLVIGAALEWYVLRVILLQESGFTFPVRFPWASAAVVAVLALAGSVLAGLGPALRAARMPIHEAIAYE